MKTSTNLVLLELIILIYGLYNRLFTSIISTKCTFSAIFRKFLDLASDQRYKAVKNLIESGYIRKLEEIFDIVPRSVIIRDTGINYTRLTNKLTHPEKFTLKDVMIIADLIEVEYQLFLNLVLASMKDKNDKNRKKK